MTVSRRGLLGRMLVIAATTPTTLLLSELADNPGSIVFIETRIINHPYEFGWLWQSLVTLNGKFMTVSAEVWEDPKKNWRLECQLRNAARLLIIQRAGAA